MSCPTVSTASATSASWRTRIAPQSWRSAGCSAEVAAKTRRRKVRRRQHPTHRARSPPLSPPAPIAVASCASSAAWRTASTGPAHARHRPRAPRHEPDRGESASIVLSSHTRPADDPRQGQSGVRVSPPSIPVVAILGGRKVRQAFRQRRAGLQRRSNKASVSTNFGPRQRPRPSTASSIPITARPRSAPSFNPASMTSQRA